MSMNDCDGSRLDHRATAIGHHCFQDRSKHLDACSSGQRLEAALLSLHIQPVPPGVERDEWAQERHRTEPSLGRRRVRLGDQRQPIQHNARELHAASDIR